MPAVDDENDALLGSLAGEKIKEGFFMPLPLGDSALGSTGSFQKLRNAFTFEDEFAFADVLSAACIEQIFQKHACAFGLLGVHHHEHRLVFLDMYCPKPRRNRVELR